MLAPLNTDFLDPRTVLTSRIPIRCFLIFGEQNPVHWSPALRAWVVTGYDDVCAIMLDQQLLSDTVTPFYFVQSEKTQSKIEILFRYLGNWLVFKNPPDHGRI